MIGAETPVTLVASDAGERVRLTVHNNGNPIPPQARDVIDGRRYLDNASPWSFSVVFVLPIAPM